MERNDIIKALGECKRHTDCSNCPYYPTIRLDIDLYCREELHKDALTLINELTEENEKLVQDVTRLEQAKQDVAREIFEEIEKTIMNTNWTSQNYKEWYFGELKKKYIGEVK